MDAKGGPAFYEDEEVFKHYMATRNHRPDNANDTLERPVMRELIGDVRGLRILDLGCGDARFGRYMQDQGCVAYLGSDGSGNMVAAAHEVLAGSSGQAIQASMEEWEFPQGAFDLVVFSLALHYVPDLEPVLAGAVRALVAGGRIIFSVEHPVITSCDRAWVEGKRGDWIVDGYFDEGPRVTSWMGGRVVKFHLTVETFVAAMQAAGFVVDRLRESRPQPETFTDEAEFDRRKRIPLFLFLAGTKPLSP